MIDESPLRPSPRPSPSSWKCCGAGIPCPWKRCRQLCRASRTPQPAARQEAISADKQGRRYLYSPLVTRDEWLLAESEGLLDRLFSGRVAPLAAHFSRHGKLTKRDIGELRRLLEELDDDQ